MNINNSIINTVHQRMQIAPQILNSLKMLKLSQSELADKIIKELADNPFLKEIKSSNVNINNVKQYSSEYTSDYNLNTQKKSQHTKNGKSISSTSTIIEKCVSTKETLSEYLLKQLRYYYNDSSPEYKTGEHLISSINKDGFISRDQLKEVFLFIKNNKLTARIIRKIQSFDPHGICSRDIKELLLIQLKMLKIVGLEIETIIIKKYLPLLAKKKYNIIVKKFNNDQGIKTTENRVKVAQKIIKSLEIKPANNFSQSPVQYITPDIVLEKITENGNDNKIYNNNGFKITIKNDLLPVIKLNKEYDSYSNCGNDNFKNYLEEKRKKAINLIDYLAFRKSNLQKVTECLFLYQIEYFKKGPEFLKPITLTELSMVIGLSEGTLSRLVNAKYILTPWGIKPLRYLFSIPVKQEFGDISPTMIKEHIKNFINVSTESPSDSQVTTMLEKKEIKIARRTVTKYRKQMKIFNSYERKAGSV